MDRGISIRSARGRWILAATILASSTAFLMGGAVPVALPTIQSQFNAAISNIQWIVNAQFVALAALLLIGGALGDHYGRKRIFSYGIVVFASGAFLSGFATSILMLISFQAIQGIGAALMIPQSLAIIGACFKERERGLAIGLWAGLSGGVAALGPLLAGWLVDTFSWEAVFFAVVPLNLLALAVTYLHVPESKSEQPRRLDWLTTAFISFGLVGIAFGLVSGPVRGWGSVPVIAALGVGILGVALFLAAERYKREPLVPPQIFGNPLVTGANTVTLAVYFALNGLIFYFVLVLQQVQGFSPTQAGLGLLPAFLLITLLSSPAGGLADKIGPRLQMIVAPAIVALGIGLLVRGGVGANYFADYLPGLIIFGLGMALVIAPLTKSALSVESRFTSVASGVNNAVSRFAGLMSIAVLGVLIISIFTTVLTDKIDSSSLSQEQRQEILGHSDELGGIKIPQSFGQEARSEAESAIRESFIYAFRIALALSAAIALTGSVVSFFTIRNPPQQE